MQRNNNETSGIRTRLICRLSRNESGYAETSVQSSPKTNRQDIQSISPENCFSTRLGFAGEDKYFWKMIFAHLSPAKSRKLAIDLLGER